MDQAKRLHGLAQQLEQEWREKRRLREMEEARAKAGGVYVGLPGVPSPSGQAEKPDPIVKLAKAKAKAKAKIRSS
jgi:hypothetical protein